MVRLNRVESTIERCLRTKSRVSSCGHSFFAAVKLTSSRCNKTRHSGALVGSTREPGILKWWCEIPGSRLRAPRNDEKKSHRRRRRIQPLLVGLVEMRVDLL